MNPEEHLVIVGGGPAGAARRRRAGPRNATPWRPRGQRRHVAAGRRLGAGAGEARDVHTRARDATQPEGREEAAPAPRRAAVPQAQVVTQNGITVADLERANRGLNRRVPQAGEELETTFLSGGTGVV